MSMKKLLCNLGLATLWALAGLPVRTAEISGLDADGYLGSWLMLAPIALPEGADAGELLLRSQVQDEAGLKPKAGDTVTIHRAGGPVTAKLVELPFL